MAVVIWEGKNLIQEPSWEKQPLEINLLGWNPQRSSQRVAQGWGLSHRCVRSGAQKSGCSIPDGPVPVSSPAFLTPLNTPRDGRADLTRFLHRELSLQHVSSNCSHRIWLWTGPCLLWGLWSVFNRTGKKFYSKCRTMNGTSVMVPEVTYTVFCYI